MSHIVLIPRYKGRATHYVCASAEHGHCVCTPLGSCTTRHARGLQALCHVRVDEGAQRTVDDEATCGLCRHLARLQPAAVMTEETA